VRRVEVPGARDLPEGRGTLLEVGARRIAVFRTALGFCALDDECPHRTGPLSEGTLETTARGTFVMCPFHGWQFDLATGGCATVRGMRVRTYAVQVDEGGVSVILPDEAEEADAPDPPDTL
jgi:nitrite reductase/ring-hydroxylating ferredoxin subunit